MLLNDISPSLLHSPSSSSSCCCFPYPSYISTQPLSLTDISYLYIRHHVFPFLSPSITPLPSPPSPCISFIMHHPPSLLPPPLPSTYTSNITYSSSSAVFIYLYIFPYLVSFLHIRLKLFIIPSRRHYISSIVLTPFPSPIAISGSTENMYTFVLCIDLYIYSPMHFYLSLFQVIVLSVQCPCLSTKFCKYNFFTSVHLPKRMIIYVFECLATGSSFFILLLNEL